MSTNKTEQSSEHDPSEAHAGPGSPVEPVNGREGQTGAQKGSDGPDDAGETFPRSYVEELRAEAAEHRVKSKRADELMVRLVRAMAEGSKQLADATDFYVNEETLPELLDDDGFPDPAKVHEAVARLLATKPHLAAVRPVGDVGQGVAGGTEQTPGLGSMLRKAAG